MSIVDVEKRKAYAKAYYKANAEKLKAAAAKYRVENPEKVKKYNDAWKLKNPDYEAKRYAANREHHIARRKRHREENPELTKIANLKFRMLNPEYDSMWKKSNREKCNASEARSRASHPEYFRMKWKLNHHRRRALKKASGGTLSKGLSAKLFKLQRGKCACCGESLGSDYHIDHILPLTLGGSNTDDNIQLLRAICNLKKGAKHPIEFMQQKGCLL